MPLKWIGATYPTYGRRTNRDRESRYGRRTGKLNSVRRINGFFLFAKIFLYQISRLLVGERNHRSVCLDFTYARRTAVRIRAAIFLEIVSTVSVSSTPRIRNNTATLYELSGWLPELVARLKPTTISRRRITIGFSSFVPPRDVSGNIRWSGSSYSSPPLLYY